MLEQCFCSTLKDAPHMGVMVRCSDTWTYSVHCMELGLLLRMVFNFLNILPSHFQKSAQLFYFFLLPDQVASEKNKIREYKVQKKNELSEYEIYNEMKIFHG